MSITQRYEYLNAYSWITLTRERKYKIANKSKLKSSSNCPQKSRNLNSKNCYCLVEQSHITAADHQLNFQHCRMGSILIIFNFENVNYQSVLSQHNSTTIKCVDDDAQRLKYWFASGQKKWNQSLDPVPSRLKVTYAITKPFCIHLRKKPSQWFDGAYFNLISS